MLTGRARDLGSGLPSRSGPAWPGASPRVLPLLVPDTAANLTIVAVTELPSKRFRGFGSCREFAILAGAATGPQRLAGAPAATATEGLFIRARGREAAHDALRRRKAHFAAQPRPRRARLLGSVRHLRRTRRRRPPLARSPRPLPGRGSAANRSGRLPTRRHRASAVPPPLRAAQGRAGVGCFCCCCASMACPVKPRPLPSPPLRLWRKGGGLKSIVSCH
ncbi:hypothetical protein QE386_001188 [Pseudoxanthomonas winnipegensis]|nr:hypothetical protein [Pseudoxanthomonas winnipegensis]